MFSKLTFLQSNDVLARLKVLVFYLFSIHLKSRVCAGFGKFWKVIEIADTIVQDLESFGKKRFFKMEKFRIFLWGNSKVS